MFFFAFLPISLMLFFICCAIWKISRERLPFQFYISDLWAAVLCSAPSMFAISSTVLHPDDKETAFFVATLMMPCQLLGICFGRLCHTISRRTKWSAHYIAGGSVFGLLIAAAAYGAFLLHGWLVTPWQHGFFPSWMVILTSPLIVSAG